MKGFLPYQKETIPSSFLLPPPLPSAYEVREDYFKGDQGSSSMPSAAGEDVNARNHSEGKVANSLRRLH